MDDLFLVNLDAKERPILLDIIEDRHGRKSIIITSQLPTDNWYDAIGDPVIKYNPLSVNLMTLGLNVSFFNASAKLDGMFL
ncbi:DNA replication protein [Dorea longicatena]|nr:DNA replication protein [Dorea longicatena]